MAEFKRNFSGGKMNKDMDERILPSGQYRDANNIQIGTSDGDDVGALQSTMGNTEVTNGIVPINHSNCVGVLPLPEKDLIYYFVSGGGTYGYSPFVKKDYIIEFDTISKTSNYVFVDIYNAKIAQSVTNSSAADKFFTISDNGSATNNTGVRVGMHISGLLGSLFLTTADNVVVTDIVKGTNSWKIYHDYQWDNGSGGSYIPISAGTYITFQSPFNERVLQFDRLIKINSINHLDGMIFWTDGNNEPKKINIKRSLLGTGGTAQTTGWNDSQLGSHASNSGNVNASTVMNISDNNADFHTRLVVSDEFGAGHQVAMQRNGYRPFYASFVNCTVIKQNPKFPLELEMMQTYLDRQPSSTSSNPTPSPNLVFSETGASGGGTLAVKWTDSSGEALAGGTNISNFYFADPVDFRIGDVIIFTNDLTSSPSQWEDDDALVRATVTDAPNGAPNNGGSAGPYDLQINAVDKYVPDATEIWLCRLEDKSSLFEFKFPRFSYRWKYQDGEYSTFAPWTSVAFIPGDFDYLAKKGYNLGMRNKLKTLRLKNYFHEFALVPADVVQVDLLYKEEGSTNVYTVKELTRKDGAPEWPDRTASNYNRGEYTLTSEMIHAVVPSNQMLRPWDNVPRKALTQEMTSNRLVFGNYTQNYDITSNIDIKVGVLNQRKSVSEYGLDIPEPSAKTLRTYQVGVVFSDDAGRESPVMVPKEGSSITLDKKWSVHCNRITAQLKYPSIPPAWAKYMKYYIKETSNEYYNLAMDRWYDAEDGNVWLSFPSAERNKVDADTYLILKNEHDSNKPVLEEGRYKVIAVVPDAPLFVKTDKKSHGSCVTSEQTGSSLATLTNIIINDTTTTGAWDSAFGSKWMEDVYAKGGPGAFFCRITGTVGTDICASKWVDIVSIKTLTATGDKSIKLGEPFGDTADAAAVIGGSPSYKLELRQDIVKNKPEFDGRFFVKVYKDLLLQKAIMKEVDATNNMTIIASYPMGFIVGGYTSGSSIRHPSNSTNTTPSHTPQYYTNSSSGGYTWQHSGSGFGFGSSNRQGYTEAWTRTKDWWFNPSSSRWMIDAVASVNHENWGTGSHRWHTNRDNGVHSSHSGGCGPGHGGMRHASSYSRIYFMARQWSSDSSTTMNQFRSTMTTSGTIWRFRDDPNQCAYVTIGYGGYSQGYNYRKSGQDHCGTSSSACKRQGFNITFEKLDGGGPVDWMLWDPLSAYRHDGKFEGSEIDILQLELGMGGNTGDSLSTKEPAIWETEPKEDIGLDIYYEASGSMPLDVTHVNNELLVPLFSTFNVRDTSNSTHKDSSGNKIHYKVMAVNSTGSDAHTKITISPALVADVEGDGSAYIHIERYDGSRITVNINKASGDYAIGDNYLILQTGSAPTNLSNGAFQPWRAPHQHKTALGYFNCWQFGNGIESDRIRDDYNAPQLTNGVKASTVLAEPYAEEHRSSGLIWSGIFNSTSGVNNLNQFIQAEPITKDLNPSYGTLQKLVSRNTDTLAFCEDKVLRLLTDKDALYNADGSSNVTASNSVIGQATPIQGDFGISTNPESMAVTSNSIYWADQMRGEILVLRGSAITSISALGMKDYFNDNLQGLSDLTGTFDDRKGEYNITLGKKVIKAQYNSTKTTISYNEQAKGWVSFRSFGPEQGISMNNEYYTWNDGSMWQHHTNALSNNFYGVQSYSDVTLIFNDQPGSVKSFNTLNYEGTRSRITQFTTVNSSGTNYTDKEYYNLTSKQGWFTESIITDLQQVDNLEYKDKEGKWFSTVKGVSTSLSNLDEKEFSVQGLGNANTETTGTPAIVRKIYIQPSPTSQINGAGTNWDTTADSSDFQVILGTQLVGTSGDTIPADQFVNSTMNNLSYNAGGGVYQYSGLDLTAKNARVHNGVSSIIGSGSSVIFRYTKPGDGNWNADPLVKYVEFSNNGIANDAANTINIKVVVDTFTMPAADKFILVDIDYESGRVNPPGTIDREACLRVSYNVDNSPLNTRATVANVTPASHSSNNIQFTANTGFLTGNSWRSDKWSGLVPQGQSTKIAEYNITADAGYHLSPTGQNGVEAYYFVRSANAAWQNYYTFNLTDTYYTSANNTNKIESTNVKVYYSPPVGVSGLDPDPMSSEGDFCSHLHDARITWLSRPIVSTQNHLVSVGLSNSNPAAGESVTVSMNANANGNVALSIQKMNSANTSATASYNFSTNAFVTLGGENSSTPLTSTITFDSTDKQGLQRLINIDLPSTNESARYCVLVTAGTLAIDANVPNAINSLFMEIAQPTGTSTFTPGPLNLTTTSGSTSILPALELSYIAQNYAFTHTWTVSSDRSIAVNGSPQDIDILGSSMITPVNGSNPAGSSTHIADTTGIKVGMQVLDQDFLDGTMPDGVALARRIPQNTTITQVVTNDSIAFSNSHSGLAAGSSILVKSDWEYELVNPVVSTTSSSVTVSGFIKICRYGKLSPNGNITLRPNNFITIS